MQASWSSSEAKQTSYLPTPYFIPDVGVMPALRIAALSGIDVRIMIPSKADQPPVRWASLSNLGESLEAGVPRFAYHEGILHAKAVTIDDFVTSVGSAIWDLCSITGNFETNAIICDPEAGSRYRRIFIGTPVPRVDRADAIGRPSSRSRGPGSSTEFSTGIHRWVGFRVRS